MIVIAYKARLALLGTFLQMQGYGVVGAINNTRKALDLFSVVKADVLITDVFLTELRDGLLLVANLRRQSPELGVVFFTDVHHTLALNVPREIQDSCYYMHSQSLTKMNMLEEAINISLDLVKSHFESNLDLYKLNEFKKDPIETLTDENLAILQLICQGYSNKKIAELKNVEPHFVEGAISELSKKLCVSEDDTGNQRVLLVKEYLRIFGKISQSAISIVNLDFRELR